MMTQGQNYRTSSIAEAAWLRTFAFELVGLDSSYSRFDFIFKDSPELREAVRLWNTGQGGAGVVGNFYAKYRELAYLVNDGKRVRREKRIDQDRKGVRDEK